MLSLVWWMIRFPPTRFMWAEESPVIARSKQWKRQEITTKKSGRSSRSSKQRQRKQRNPKIRDCKMTMNEKQVDKILTADELRQQKEQAEILEAQRTHEEQSSWFSFMSLHCGVKGVYGDGTGLPNVDRLV